MPTEPRPVPRIPASIWARGFVSRLPVFMAATLGLSALSKPLFTIAGGGFSTAALAVTLVRARRLDGTWSG